MTDVRFILSAANALGLVGGDAVEGDVALGVHLDAAAADDLRAGGGDVPAGVNAQSAARVAHVQAGDAVDDGALLRLVIKCPPPFQ